MKVLSLSLRQAPGLRPIRDRPAVYFLRLGETDWLKVGQSIRVDSRMRQHEHRYLRAGGVWPLAVLYLPQDLLVRAESELLQAMRRRFRSPAREPEVFLVRNVLQAAPRIAERLAQHLR